MATEVAVINFGCPRSGTTFLRRCTGNMPGVFATKLAEHSALHPCQSTDGLIRIGHWLHKETPVFLRTVRDPLEIAESFAATKRDELRKRAGGLANNSPGDVVHWIRSESESTHAQDGELVHPKSRRRVEVIHVRYEKLGEEGYRQTVADEVAEKAGKRAAKGFLIALRTFGGEPARVGRLSAGLDRVLSDDERDWYAAELRDIREREGYG